MPLLIIKYIKPENKIYSSIDADTIVPETMGVFSNNKKHLLENIHNFHNIQCVKNILDINESHRFESYSGWKSKYFYPVCSKENWSAFKHYFNGGTIISTFGGFIYEKTKLFDKSEPPLDWINNQYKILEDDNIVNEIIRIYKLQIKH